MRKVDAAVEFIARNTPIMVREEGSGLDYPDFMNKHEGHEIVMVVSGKGDLVVEGSHYPLRTGELAFIGEGEYHNINVSGHCRYVHLNFRPHLVFSHPDLLQSFLRPFTSGMNGGSHKIVPSAAVRKTLAEIVAWSRTEGRSMTRLCVLVSQLAERFGSLKIPVFRAPPRVRQKLAPALDLLYRNYREPLPMDRLAKACGLSRASFFRLFSSTCGKTPNATIMELRLRHAQHRLMLTDVRVADVANESGFLNLSHFNRLFRREMGLTPLEYRAKSRR